MKPKSKIVKRLENLINQISSLSRDKDLPYSVRYDFWKRRVELFLRRVCGDKTAEEFKTIVKEEPHPDFIGLFRDEPIEQRLERQRKKAKLYCQAALCEARNLLKAVKEDIEFFESDKEAKKEVDTIKRKYKEWGFDLKILKHKRGEETETKGQ